MGTAPFFYADLRGRRVVGSCPLTVKTLSRPDKPRRAVTMQQGIYMAFDIKGEG